MGSIEGAERAMTNAIETVESGFSAHVLSVDTARATLQISTFSEELSSLLPLELRALFLPLPTYCCCFAPGARVALRVTVCEAGNATCRSSAAIVVVRLDVWYFIQGGEEFLTGATRRSLLQPFPSRHLFGKRRRENLINGNLLRLGD